MEKLFNPKYKYAPLTEKLSDLVTHLPSFVFFFFFGVFLVYLSDRTIPARLYDGKVITQNIHSGDSVIFDYKVDRYKICDVDYNNIVVDSTGTRFPLVDLPAMKNRKVISGDVIRLGITLPKGMEPGLAVYKSERQYICNFTQRWLSPLTVENPDISFNIEP